MVFVMIPLIALAPRPALGQWQTSGSNIYYNNGNVGIGTAPASLLHVAGPSNLTNVTVGAPGNGVFDILAWGGSTAGFADLSSNVYFNGSTWNLRNLSNDAWMLAMNTYTGGGNWGVYHANSGGSPAALTPFFYIGATGNVGIGTGNPQYLLSVKGTIGAEEFIVTNTGWSDYVFRPDYHLQPLREVGAYIQANHHLPDIPSEVEVKEKGVSMGEMQTKLLAKIEELTLHMIREHDRNDRLEQQNQELRDRIGRLEKSAAGPTPAPAR